MSAALEVHNPTPPLVIRVTPENEVEVVSLLDQFCEIWDTEADAAFDAWADKQTAEIVYFSDWIKAGKP